MRQYRAPRADGGDMLVELRAEGGQTVVPPSVHESGERIEWDEDDGRDSVELHDAALAISAAELSERVRRLACAALVMRHHGETIARRLLREHSWPRLPEVTLARIREWGGFVQPRRAAPRAASVGDGVIARVQAYLRRVPPAVSGQGGHAATFLVAQHLVLGFELDGEVALAALAEWNASCQPPWSEKELRHKIRQAAERGRSVSAGAHLGGDR